MKAVQFGAGNIGRGFIGLLLSRSGLAVSFVDVNENLVNLLNARKQYEVILANAASDAAIVRQVAAINGNDIDQVTRAVAEADLVTTAVGLPVLKAIAAGIASGIELRLQSSIPAPLHIIACENAIGGSTQLKAHVYSHLSAEYQQLADRFIRFPDAAVDRIVPLQHHDDPLMVTVEPFHEWVVDGSSLLEGFPVIEGMHLVSHLEPYIERKLFTVNTGHCCAAYHGYLRGYATIQQAMKDEAVQSEVRNTLQETGAMLIRKYGFDEQEHMDYISSIMARFINPYLMDEVVRVGRSPVRKLSPDDRLIRPALAAHALGLEVAHLARAAAAALRFNYKEDPEAVQLQESLARYGLHPTITTYTGIPETHSIHQEIARHYEALN